MTNKEKLLIIADKVSECTACDLHKSRLNTVSGEGSFNPLVMFIGEGPGENEDREGIPFCGDSGVLLNYICNNYLKLFEDDYFISNIVKCRPPNNRDPKPSEINSCSFWLRNQIKVLEPEIIVTLGRISSQHFLGDEFKTGITNYAGKFYTSEKLSYRNKLIYPVPHPSWFIRKGRKKELWGPYFLVLKESLETIYNDT